MKDLIGKEFGILKVIGFGYKKNGHYWWSCRCKCGKEKDVNGDYLLRKNQENKSCGCIRVKKTVERNINNKYTLTHGMSQTTEYHAWENIIQRCTNNKHPEYKDYGGRGITVCSHWFIFENFYNDMGDKPTDKYTIERKNNNGNYEPSNCTWSTQSEQNFNRRPRSTRRQS